MPLGLLRRRGFVLDLFSTLASGLRDLVGCFLARLLYCVSGFLSGLLCRPTCVLGSVLRFRSSFLDVILRVLRKRCQRHRKQQTQTQFANQCTHIQISSGSFKTYPVSVRRREEKVKACSSRVALHVNLDSLFGW